ncbi:hypothetical protein ACWEQ1_02530 [Streptomyces nodosus]
MLATLALAPLALSACGSQDGRQSDASAAHPSTAVDSSRAPRSDEASSQATNTDNTLGNAAREAAARRAAAAASGDPVAPKETNVPDPADYGFGKPASTTQKGEVVAYAPRRESGRLYVPITIHNGSDKRVTYHVNVTVVGGKQDSRVTVKTQADNVFPGTTWPTQVDITAVGADTNPADVQIRLEAVRDVYPFGDSH